MTTLADVASTAGGRNPDGSHVLSKAFIGLAGLIGVGKTTLAQALADHLDLDVRHEPVDDNAYLEDFYTDTARYSFAMQVYLLNARFQQHQEIIWSGRGAVQDRTIYEDSIFAKVLSDMGLMHPRDYQTYLSLFRNLSNFMCKPTAIVYLHCPPDVCYERIQARAREVESGVTLEYLMRLYEEYEAFVQGISRTIPVIRVPWDRFGETQVVADAIGREVGRVHYLRDVTL